MLEVVGGQTETGRLRRVALKHARDAFVNDAKIADQWQALNYLSRPNFVRAVSEYEGFVALLRQFDVAPWASTRSTCATSSGSWTAA